MKTTKRLLTVALWCAAAMAAQAQEPGGPTGVPSESATPPGVVYYRRGWPIDWRPEAESATLPGVVYYRRAWPIDWRPEAESALYGEIASRRLRRHTLAVHPYHLMREGLKFDFETELREPGQWLRFSAMGYVAPGTKTDASGERYHRWGTLASGWEEFDAMWGAGLGVGYKAMLTYRGLYFGADLLYNFYAVDYDAVRYLPLTQDGLTFYERRRVGATTRFHQPALTISLGKHMALGRHAFVDMFVGMGYMYSLYSGPAAYTDYVAFGYRGGYFNAGLRLGVLWFDRK